MFWILSIFFQVVYMLITLIFIFLRENVFVLYLINRILPLST